MLKFCYILLFVIPGVLFSKVLPLNLERMVVDLKGVSYNDKSIIVYGEEGIIMRSNDRGSTWNQMQIDNGNFNINKIRNIGNTFYGVTAKGKLIVSSDNGFSWKNYLLDEDAIFNDIEFDGEKIYILTNNEVLIYNYYLNRINTIEVRTSANLREFILFNNRLFITADSSLLYIINMNDENNCRIINFRTLGLTSSNAAIKCPKNINEKIYLSIGGEMFFSPDTGQSWLKYNNDIACYTLNTGKVYSISPKSNEDHFVSYPEFFQLDINRKIKLNNDTISRYIYLKSYNALEFISSDTLICVADDKTIYMSYNSGRNWNLISNMNINTTQGYFVDEKIAYFWGSKGQVFRTVDGCNTFLPQVYKEYYQKVFPNCDIMCFDEQGYGVLFRISHIRNSINFLRTKDFGDTYDTLSISDLLYTPNSSPMKIVNLDTNIVLFFPIVSPLKQTTAVHVINKQDFTIKTVLFDFLFVLNEVYLKN